MRRYAGVEKCDSWEEEVICWGEEEEAVLYKDGVVVGGGGEDRTNRTWEVDGGPEVGEAESPARHRCVGLCEELGADLGFAFSISETGRVTTAGRGKAWESKQDFNRVSMTICR